MAVGPAEHQYADDDEVWLCSYAILLRNSTTLQYYAIPYATLLRCSTTLSPHIVLLHYPLTLSFYTILLRYPPKLSPSNPFDHGYNGGADIGYNGGGFFGGVGGLKQEQSGATELKKEVLGLRALNEDLLRNNEELLRTVESLARGWARREGGLAYVAVRKKSSTEKAYLDRYVVLRERISIARSVLSRYATSAYGAMRRRTEQYCDSVPRSLEPSCRDTGCYAYLDSETSTDTAYNAMMLR
eukprot:100234-Rhodomonas_salina.4